MLNKLDDFPVHQTPEPLAQPATSDPNFYDRTWFNGYRDDAQQYFALGLAVYPVSYTHLTLPTTPYV